ncbi:MAG: hypothetical protein ACRCT8_15495 [Lacipirellulaceae bacterium]
MLALSGASGPSVIQLRGRNVLPGDVGSIILGALSRYDDELAAGALVVVNVATLRVRVLPLSQR